MIDASLNTCCKLSLAQFNTTRRGDHSMYRALPVQLTPKYLGSLQIHTKDPLVLWHTVRPLQLCIPFAHSSVSVNQKVVLNYIYHYIYIYISDWIC